MQLRLSCVCCGSTDFKRTKQEYYDIEGESYLFHEDEYNFKVICKECGLEDYVSNLVIKFC